MCGSVGEVANRRYWSDGNMLDEMLPKLQDGVGEFVFGQFRREVRGNYAQLVSELNSRLKVVVIKKTDGGQLSHNKNLVNQWKTICE